jgi:biofilm protein TabA
VGKRGIRKMIVCDLNNWNLEKNAFHSAIQMGIEYIKNTDIGGLKPGKYEIQGKEIYAQIQEVKTKSIVETKPESHARYLDVHYLFNGSEEIIGVSKVNPNNKIFTNDFETKDIAFYDSVGEESFIQLKPDMFAIFFPADIHRPCCHVGKSESIKKVVIKIDSFLLNDCRIVQPSKMSIRM